MKKLVLAILPTFFLAGCLGGGSTSGTSNSASSNTTFDSPNKTTSNTTTNSTTNTATNATANPTQFIGGNGQGNSLQITGATSMVASGLTSPGHITTDGTNIFATDAGVIQKISISTGTVTTVIGNSGTCTATLCNAKGVTTDGTNLYVVDGQGTVSKISIATGISSVLATGLNLPGGAMTTDGANLYVSEFNGIRKISISSNTVSTWGSGSGLNNIASLQDMTTDGKYLYFINGYAIQKADIATGTISNVAGAVGTSGSADGNGGLATLRPWGIATDGVNLYVSQYSGGIRKIELATGNVTTISSVSATGVTTDGSSLFYAAPHTTINKVQ